ncbi:MAG: hypothetical protein Wins2KO_29610 [Winogradskyella sp.]
MKWDKKIIIENGLLEQYLLGELNNNECQQIEEELASNAELKSYFEDLEKDFETLGLENAVAPPEKLKTQLLSQIKESDSSEVKVVSIKNNFNTKTYFQIAVSIAALLMMSTFWLYNQLADFKEEQKIVNTENEKLINTLENLNNKLESETALFATLSHSDTEQYILNGNALMPNGKVVSYINHSTKAVVINTEKLPKLDDDHDYQMWADVEGEMINMGVIPKDNHLLAMSYIENSESLNITIEPAGGNDHPTVEKLVTNVYLR